MTLAVIFGSFLLFKLWHLKLQFYCFQTCMLLKTRELRLISTQTDPIELNIVVKKVKENKSVYKRTFCPHDKHKTLHSRKHRTKELLCLHFTPSLTLIDLQESRYTKESRMTSLSACPFLDLFITIISDRRHD